MGQYVYKYPMPAVTVDLVAFVLDADAIRVLMIRRKRDPFAGLWALPGGFVEIDEPFEIAARREMKEETGLVITSSLHFIGLFGQPGRDPRGRTISVAHAAVLRGPGPVVRGSDDAAEARWLAINERHDLAFDHADILAAARSWLEEHVAKGQLGLAMLPQSFRSSDVRSLHKAVFGDDRLARSWLVRLIKMGYVQRSKSHGVYVARTMEVEPTRYSEPFQG